MGMTDSQFKTHIRMLIKMINEAQEEEEKELILKKLELLKAVLQAALED